MNVMDLFSGIGGGILGGLLCGHRTVCAVELDPYCRSVLVRRQNDGRLPPFPIWDDIRTFDGREWRGIVDVVSGGFPCQNISPAGDRTGITGSKSSLWFEMSRIVREVRPQYVFVENSAQLVRNGLDVVLTSFDKSGYDAEWCVLGADDVGAPHSRKRCWILGKSTDTMYERCKKNRQPSCRVAAGQSKPSRLRSNVPDTDGQRKQQSQGCVKDERRRTGDVCTEISDTGNNRTIEWQWKLPGDQQTIRSRKNNGRGTAVNAFREWWQVEPGLGRVVDGISNRMERISGLGNAQVPLCAAVAWSLLYERINNESEENDEQD